jgi:pimeloyl-ACP methyl ester carboxylesterase
MSGVAHALNILASDDISMDVPIADKSADEKAIILDPKAYLLIKGHSTERRLRILYSNKDKLVLRLNAPVKPGAYELFAQAPGRAQITINNNVEVHAPEIIESKADDLNPGARIYLSGLYFGYNPRLSIIYHKGDRAKLYTQSFSSDARSYQYDDPWDKSAALYPTDSTTGDSYLEALIPKLPLTSEVVAIRLTTDTGQTTIYSRAFRINSTPRSRRPMNFAAHKRGELIGWSIRDSEIRNTNTWNFMLDGLTDQGDWWTKTAANSLLVTTKLWREMKYSVRLFNLSYYTEDTKGRIVPSAGVLVIPKRSPGTKTPLVSFQHGTMFERRQAPTVSNGPELGMAIAMASASGFLMTIPDHLGLGIEALKHPEQFHPYCQWAPLARDNGDMLVAAKALLQDESFHQIVHDGPTHDGRLFLTGYSEGGYLTLGLHRELESHPEQYGNLKVTASVPLSGGYASSTIMLDKLMERQKFTYPGFAAYLWITLNRTYGVFSTPDQYLATPFDMTLSPLIDGQHSEGEVNYAMPPIVSDILLPKVRSDLIARVGEFFSATRANDLAGGDGSGYRLEAPVHFIHGFDDELVPRGNTERAVDYLKNKQLNRNVDAQYLESNLMMKTAYWVGLPFHASYAPLAIGESLEWLDQKIIETQPLVE